MSGRYMRVVPLLLSMLLAGCFAGAGQRVETASYDLAGVSMADRGPADVQDGGAPPSLLLRLAEVQAPAWLGTPAMQYRLAYSEPERRFAFAESRWVAPPAELLDSVLRRGNIVTRSRFEADGCQLHVELQEFIQVFDTPASSRAVMEARVSLLAPRNARLLAQRSFRQSPSAGVDARGGVAGFVVAVRDMGREFDKWLSALQREKPELMTQCRAGML